MRVTESAASKGRIRRAHVGDVPDLARVQVDSWHAGYGDIVPAEELRKLSYSSASKRFGRLLGQGPRAGLVHVFHDRNGVAGYTTIGRQQERRIRFAGEVFEIYVHPDRWGQGIGRRLLGHAIWTLVEYRLNPVMLWVLTENVRGRRFYEACGGRPLLRAPIQLGEKATTKIAYGWDQQLPLPLF
jgi:hypothetical protein